MSIEERLRVVRLAEVECERHADSARSAWTSLKSDFTDAATPWRIVTVGVIGGFFMGRSGGGPDGSAGVGAKLFGTVANALITTLGASATAGMAAGAAADAAASATVDAVAEGAAPPEARVAAAQAINANNKSAAAAIEEDPA